MKKVLLAFLCMVVMIAPLATAESFRFIVTGDSRGSNNGINEPILTELAAAIISEGAELVLVSGDLVDNGSVDGQLEYWIEKFMEPLMAAGVVVLPTPGNHDRVPYPTGATRWDLAFSGPYELPQNGPAEQINKTYTYLHRNALFISLHQCQIPLACTEPLDQEWFEQQVATRTVPHVFVFGHYPAYSVDHADCLANFPEQRDAFWNTLAKSGSPVYFTGHDHFYNHAIVKAANGIDVHQYVVGTAGAPLRDWDGTYNEAAVIPVSHASEYGYAVVDVDDFKVTIRFKKKVAANTFADIGDVVRYQAPLMGEGVPASTPWTLIAASLVIVMLASAFAYRRMAA